MYVHMHPSSQFSSSVPAVLPLKLLSSTLTLRKGGKRKSWCSAGTILRKQWWLLTQRSKCKVLHFFFMKKQLHNFIPARPSTSILSKYFSFGLHLIPANNNFSCCWLDNRRKLIFFFFWSQDYSALEGFITTFNNFMSINWRIQRCNLITL